MSTKNELYNNKQSIVIDNFRIVIFIYFTNCLRLYNIFDFTIYMNCNSLSKKVTPT